MTLTTRLAHTDVKILEVLGYLPWARIYQDGQDVTFEVRASDRTTIAAGPVLG